MYKKYVVKELSSNSTETEYVFKGTKYLNKTKMNFSKKNKNKLLRQGDKIEISEYIKSKNEKKTSR